MNINIINAERARELTLEAIKEKEEKEKLTKYNILNSIYSQIETQYKRGIYNLNTPVAREHSDYIYSQLIDNKYKVEIKTVSTCLSQFIISWEEE